MSQAVHEGTDVNIYCKSITKALWYHNNEILKKKMNNQFLNNGIVLRNVQQEDVGIYKCVGRGPGGIVFSRSSKLSIVGKLESSVCTSPVIVIELSPICTDDFQKRTHSSPALKVDTSQRQKIYWAKVAWFLLLITIRMFKANITGTSMFSITPSHAHGKVRMLKLTIINEYQG